MAEVVANPCCAVNVPLATTKDVTIRVESCHSDSERRGRVVVSYHCINYTVSVREGRSWIGKKTPKTILFDVSGVMKPGLNAVLGRSGSGKTSLIKILAGRKKYCKFSGHVLLNGRLMSQLQNETVGYVDQNDVAVLGSLTVKENISFSAALRLPGSTAKEKRQARVETVLSELRLSDVADSKVGNEIIRGISGGERKRTSIGMELVISPSVLYLDEPTTGLDAFTATTVIQLLQQLSQNGKTIIFSIHQPKYSLFKMFDSITLLEKGQCVYHGPAGQSIQYFRQLGFVCELHDNPADFFMDAIQSASKKDEDNQESSLLQSYKASSYFKSTEKEISEEFVRVQSSEVPKLDQVAEYPTSFLRQMATLSQRTLLDTFRNPATSVMTLFSSFVIALALGLLLFQINYSPVEGVQDRLGYFFFVSTFLVLQNNNKISLFIDKRNAFKHESRGGYYYVSAYFISQVMCDIIPQRLLPVIPFSVISYFLIGLEPTASQFFYAMVILMLTTCCGAGIVYLASSVFETMEKAHLVLTLTFLLMTVFGGLLINVKAIPSSIKWIKYTSFIHYSTEALAVNEMHGMNFCISTGPDNNCPIGNGTMRGDHFLAAQGFDPGNKLINPIVLACIFCGLLLLSYARLRYMRRT